jgi:hypothetical protein
MFLMILASVLNGCAFALMVVLDTSANGAAVRLPFLEWEDKRRAFFIFNFLFLLRGFYWHYP